MKKWIRFSKPGWYWITWQLLLLIFFWGTITSGLYTLYAFAVGLCLQVISLFANLPRELIEEIFLPGWFPVSSGALLSLFFVIGVVFAARFLSIYIMAQFALPISRWEERQKAANSFKAFVKGRKGVAIFVKEANIIASGGETEDASGGVALVDLSSAVALSQQKDTESWNILDEGRDEAQNKPGFLSSFWKKKEQTLFVDVKGPGLVFLDDGQKVFSSIDLRPQSRKADVTAYTRNGIQVTAQVAVTFSLSGDPDVISVGYVDAPEKDAPEKMEWRWLAIEEDSTSGTMTIKDAYELEPQDYHLLEAYVTGKPGQYSSPEASSSALDTPYKFYAGRVFNAASSKARSVKTGELVPWHEAPLEIAIDTFRKELLTTPYDDLYTGLAGKRDVPIMPYDDHYAGLGKKDMQDAARQTVDALKKLKESFARKMKLKGIVLFQYHARRDGKPFQVGDVLRLDEVARYPFIEAAQSDFDSLRSVGVSIKSASFSNVQPAGAGIKKRMVENWKARWNREVSFINAEHELESTRIQNRNRAQIQQEMTHLFSSIFQGSHTDEALALRVFQALESAAVNPGPNNDMTAREVVDMLDSLHRWLLVDRKDLPPDKPGDAPAAPDGSDEKIH